MRTLFLIALIATIAFATRSPRYTLHEASPAKMASEL